MGDERRNDAFALFIKKRFPKVKTILVVADGKCVLSRKLTNKKFTTIAMDAAIRNEKTHKKIKYIKGWFDRNYPIPEEVDLIVGMHPDEATAEIILAAKKNNLPWAIVPCCLKGKESKNVQNFTDWINKLKNFDYPCNEAILKIKGKNKVLFKQK